MTFDILRHGIYSPQYVAFLACGLIGTGSGCAPRTADLTQLRTWMTGSFSNSQQSNADPQNFRDIDLHIVPIWPDRGDGPWLYVEQVDAKNTESPLNQCVYQLRACPDQKIENVVYSLPGDPLRFTGAWRDPIRFNAISPRNLRQRDGCAIILRKSQGGVFVGSTEGQACRSDNQGASYTTTEVFIDPGHFAAWERGFDSNDEQVWGPTAGGYVFLKSPVPQ